MHLRGLIGTADRNFFSQSLLESLYFLLKYWLFLSFSKIISCWQTTEKTIRKRYSYLTNVLRQIRWICKILLSVKNISATLKETVYKVSSNKNIIIYLLNILFFLLRSGNMHKYKHSLLISPFSLTDPHLILTVLCIFQPMCSKYFIKALKIIILILQTVPQKWCNACKITP